ncbi:crotonobetainyl-CoA:carnitine CoA-transferase CaiB-like acyl-CoA transferase [Bacillus pakistanensis]|uniref:Crotonobetainyl-CoA:carnitine CoA-transferase CaiB-like acyl-CoA transferase n=1 Tax=Rossellomorea pakistanensis TaxID=992288 RepID=A0ABS2N6Y0_9BACI|nr:CoA transferase [Bacillus pakistanensis]MBM7583560.1 crotonobetainyl-CoA:carnitine CoA-transferase CaiB-like acyl-CoA transferase [Bacillus pakistanensis]
MFEPLEGIRILDLSRIYASPAGSMILGDLGADVIRIESPEGTDTMRDWWPFVEDQSTYYLTANRNKRSVTINLKSESGKELFLKLVKNADVIMENYKTGTLERLGLGYEELKKHNPTIILCSVTGYGQTGPYRNEPGYDPVIQAIGGLMDVTGHADGDPTRVGLPVVDIIASLYTSVSILSAIFARNNGGAGQHIDISLLDVQISSLANVASSYLMKGFISKRMGNQHNNVVPYQVFQCEDRPMMIAVGNDQQFKKLCNILGRPEWITDEKYKTNAARVENRDDISTKIQAIFKERTADEWFRLLSEQGIPSGPVNNVEQVFQHPQVQAREMVEEIPHPTLGKVKLVRNPIRFSDASLKIKKHPPLLGEHTLSFLKEELHLGDDELDILRAQGVI